jgi:uncharacterized membrane protein YheB (UPF0754 family)
MSTSEIFILLTPVMTGLIGWFTNWVAVKMLFKPVKPINFGLFKLQGIFPKRQDKLAASIGRMVAEELLTNDDIREKILDRENIDGLLVMVEDKVDNYLNNDFPIKHPVTSFFMGKRRREKIKNELMEEVDNWAPMVIEKIMDDLDKTLKIEEMIAKKVAALPPDKLEKLLNGILKKEFKFIEWSGAILGFFVGVVQVIFIESFK